MFLAVDVEGDSLVEVNRRCTGVGVGGSEVCRSLFGCQCAHDQIVQSNCVAASLR